VDALVIGSGPAGWAAAAACRAAGLQVEIVAPDPEAPFVATYCVWTDELDPSWASTFQDVWPAVMIASENGGQRRIQRSYACFDNERLRARLREQAEATVSTGRVESVQADDDQLLVHLSGGRTRRTDYVIDASGASSALVRREIDSEPAVQTALGRVIRRTSDDDLLPTLMDYRPTSEAAPASFGYVLPYSDGTVLVEETILAARPAVPPDALVDRLDRRIADLGWTDAEVVHTERVHIPMGAALPVAEQPVVPYGAAASMVHPATGYLVGLVLRRAPVLTRALKASTRESSPLARATHVNRSLWPRSLRRTRALHALGLEVLLRLDRDQVPAFFDAFFRTPRWSWTAYLRVDAPPSRLAASMAASFAVMDGECRRRVEAEIRSRGLLETGRSVWAA
jgi:lycopene beta-cyclase